MTIASIISDSAAGDNQCAVCGYSGGGFSKRGYYRKCPHCRGASRIESERPEVLEEYWRGEAFWSEEEVWKRKRREPVFEKHTESCKALSQEQGPFLTSGVGLERS